MLFASGCQHSLMFLLLGYDCYYNVISAESYCNYDFYKAVFKENPEV